MSSVLVFAASLAAALVAWHVLGLIPARGPRGVLRAAAIALLCSPGILVGHGLGVAPALLALWLQPSPFSIGPVLIVWLVACGAIAGFPALCNRPVSWPPTTRVLFAAHRLKFAVLGGVAASLMLAALRANLRRDAWEMPLQLGLFLAGGLANLLLCLGAARVNRGGLLETPLWFAVPALPVAAPLVPLGWYAGGLVGGFIGTRRRRATAHGVGRAGSGAPPRVPPSNGERE